MKLHVVHDKKRDEVCKICKMLIMPPIKHECDPSICTTCLGTGIISGSDCTQCGGSGKARFT